MRYISKPHNTKKEGCNQLGQCTSYYCAPHSLKQCLRKFGINKYNEKQLAQLIGTTSKGSTHEGINTAILKISKETRKKLSIKWVNFSSLANTRSKRFEALGKIISSKNKAVITHIGYQGNGESVNGAIFGHYEVLDIIDTSTGYVRALNSLGRRKKDGSYAGHLQDRKYNLEAQYIANKNQPSIGIITLK